MKASCVLGLLELTEAQHEYKLNGDSTNHVKTRLERMDLIADWAKPLCYFEVYRKDFKLNQIHCLLEDASILVYNKETKRIVTVFILSPNSLEKYIPFLIKCINKSKLDKLYKYTKLNKKSKAYKVNKSFHFTEKQMTDYHLRKYKIHKI